MSTQIEIAVYLDLSERRVRFLLTSGVLPTSKGRGGYDLDICRVAYIRYLRGIASGQIEKSAAGDESENEDFEKLIDEEKYRKIKRENDIEERGVIPLEEIVDVLQAVSKQAVSILEALPLNIKRRVPMLKAKDIEYIQLEIAKCRNAVGNIEVSQ